MQYLSIALPLAALVSGAFANPFKGNPHCTSDACLAAVTGKAALGDDGLRKFHCSSYLATTVTPAAITVTETITAEGKPGIWPRASVTVCPNEVPNYASACNDAAYSSACACFGFTEVKTFTIAPTTTTKTVFVKPTAGTCSVVTKTITGTTTVVSGTTCPAPATVTSTDTTTTTKTVGGGHGATPVTVTTTDTTTVTSTTTSVKFIGGSGSTLPYIVTITETSTVPASATTITEHGSAYTSTVTSTITVHDATTTRGSPVTTSSAPASTCVVDDAKATELVNGFLQLLRLTSYAGNATLGIPAGHGYPQDVSNAILSPKFSDISDSINFMAGFSLGSTTFPTKFAFDYGQGVLQPEVAIDALNIWHDCSSITWRWRIFSTALPVTGINYMIIDPADGKILKNYAEFDNGAWLQSFGRQCASSPIAPVQNPPSLKRSENNFAMLE